MKIFILRTSYPTYRNAERYAKKLLTEWNYTIQDKNNPSLYHKEGKPLLHDVCCQVYIIAYKLNEDEDFLTLKLNLFDNQRD